MTDYTFSSGVVRFIEANVHSAVLGQSDSSTTDNHEAACAAFDSTVQELTATSPTPLLNTKNIAAPSKVKAAQDQINSLKRQICSLPETPAPQEKTQQL